MTLREAGAVTGVGETKYLRGTDRSALSFQLEASLTAIRDAGLKPSDIDGLIPYGHGAVAEDFITNFGIQDLRFSATTPMGGASAVASIQCALAVIEAGICNHVLLSLGRTGYSGGRIGTRVQQMPQFRVIGEFEMPLGAIAPAQLYAPMARRHMETVWHDLTAVGGGGGDDAVSCVVAVERDDAQSDHDRGSSGLADDFRSVTAAGLLAWRATAGRRW